MITKETSKAMENIRPWSGPSVTWNYYEVVRMVDEFGFEDACLMISRGMFQLDYVKKTVREFLESKKISYKK